ncbi:elongation of very long chain fatty acids protein 6-like [Apis laboriosa]|uniref:Elongation of very long chain fatty acids protein n=2 Tax=Apis TaxID=7459 RepID=A0A7M7LKB3_APIME|nr:elongation of very long chain fatty acids protein 6 [Apis mellifera]XP_003695768.1 elongation of very long chain fatty acids protein 6-like [Apis florea]XP_006621044.1 elongation of very long chain fatty acids protein 6-like [Apis dorsata]XP_016908972.1 elongation of very long chain fatty acids protein 6 [Apis cerana]XP_043791908.1 elongation of very long chain fatty acids protein 6-like [Apis laboriosa]XP_043791909.1 elongation of very long chain fatty acids protein 6-like [Apis laboriosa]|eukprot:XP_003251850.1 elongation of very long chain fatty acids protein 6 [Apis mellifera]
MNKLSYMEVVTVPNYSYVFNFEENFIHTETKVWMTKNWTNCFYYCGIYMILIFGGKHYMSTRPRFELRGVLALWNTLLASFSIIGLTRTLPELVHVLKHYGFYHSVCIPSFIEQDVVSGFWTWMFVLSKLPELGDTIFIVLRKQELIFLHWYHHITVLLYSWFSYSEYTASARWFVVMNFFIHSIMYSYYALKAMQYRPPKICAMLITVLQITQMFIGCIINISAHQYLENQIECHISRLNVKLSLLMYFSYFILFCRFFQRSYINKGGKFQKKGFTNGTVEYDKLKAN